MNIGKAVVRGPSSPLRVAVVRVSDRNRDVEAHSILRRKGFGVRSLRTGSHMQTPGPAPSVPVAHDSPATQKQMHSDLVGEDRDCSSNNGLLHILGRTERIKPQPERRWECSDPAEVFSIRRRGSVAMVAEPGLRAQEALQPVQAIVVDRKTPLAGGGRGGSLLICERCQGLRHVEDWEDGLDELLLAGEEKTGKCFLHTFCFY
ncbi:RNA polymerase II subunit A C-terminal domain phosphatase SSU72 like protein 6-like [Glossophaga mutica]